MTAPIGSPSHLAAEKAAAAALVHPAATGLGRAPGATGAPGTPSRAQLVEAAKQFDAVFVRIVLSSLQKTTKMGGGSGLSAGQSTYGSMVVDTVADAVTRAGGTGLADKLMEALGPRLAAQEAHGGPPPVPQKRGTGPGTR